MIYRPPETAFTLQGMNLHNPTIDLWNAIKTTTKLIIVTLAYHALWNVSVGWHLRALALAIGLILTLYWINRP